MKFSSRKLTYLSVVLIIGLIISTSGLTVLYLNLNRDHDILQDEFMEISSEVEGLRYFSSHLKLGSNGSEIISTLTSQQIYNLVEPSVVKITIRVQSVYGLIPYGQGSGFIYDDKGYIITNYHVIKGANTIEVTFLDGAILEAELVGADPYSDLVIIKVDPTQKDLQPLLIGNSSMLEVGDSVVAVGNPFGLSGSMTEGIVSQLDRTMSTQYGYMIVGVIQTDAAINPGNSGGPLLNKWGEVVGVNTAITSNSGDFSGVGFAIPSNLMDRVASSLINNGSYIHPWLGLAGVDVTPAIAEAMGLNFSKGFLVSVVAPGSPVGKAGIRVGNNPVIIDGQSINIGGDIIIGIDDASVRKLEDLLVYIENNLRPHDKATLEIIRNNEAISVPIELEERPPPS